MANTPFRGGPKIGRNDPCFYGSSRKFKHCHGRVQHTLPALLTRSRVKKEIIKQGRRHFENHKVQELQRQKQQGLGRPIISTEYKGYRFVAVGSQLHYGKWKTFPDFLAKYIKHILDGQWGNAEIAKPLAERHPILQWYDKICRLQAEHAKEPGALFSTPMTGAVSAYHRLAYNLYLIALFLLATGARLNEALRARWEYVDKEHRVWRTLAADSKSGHMRSVPLNDSAIAVLDQLDTAGTYDHLFINRKTGKPYTTICKTWEGIRAEAGLNRLRLHDLRHSAASYMAQAGVSLYVIQQVLGHSNPSVTQRYAHLSAETLLNAANCTSDVIQGAMPEPA